MSDVTKPTLLSIRSALVDSVSNLVSEAGLRDELTNIVVDLVYHLSEYREEESPLYPDVYLIDFSNKLDVLKEIAPGMERVPIGKTQSADCVERVLKDCAALANNSWSIYLQWTIDSISYGLFRTFELPFSISASENLSNPNSATEATILIRNCSSHCVELIPSSGKRMEFSLTSAHPPNNSVSMQISDIAHMAMSTIEQEERDEFQAYFQRILTEIFRKTHGTLVAVVSSNIKELPPELSDGVVLTSPIDIIGAAKDLKSEGNSSSLSRLLARETLLQGMISSDGITILATNCTIRAFRIFIKPTSYESELIDKLEIRGGARSRAFELLKLRIGAQIKCAFFRSQDGRTECVVDND